jgi:hypothetical protein
MSFVNLKKSTACEPYFGRDEIFLLSGIVVFNLLVVVCVG